MKRILSILTIALVSFLLASCEKEAEQIPLPPSYYTLKMDLTSFNDLSSLADSKSVQVQPASDRNAYYEFVSNTVLFNWKTIYNSILYIPVKGYELLVDTTPEEGSDGTWTWTSEYSDAIGNSYVTKLYGKVVGDNCLWDLRVSKNGLAGYTDYCWLTGWSTLEGGKGEWNLQAGPDRDELLVTVEWTITPGLDFSAKFTYKYNKLLGLILPSYYGSYVDYKMTASDDAYDSTFTAYVNWSGLVFVNADIEWSHNTNAGRVKCPDQYGDSEWHSWDAFVGLK